MFKQVTFYLVVFSASAPLALIWGWPQWFLPAQKGWLSCSAGSCWTITNYGLLYWSVWKLVSILVHGTVTTVVQQLPPKQLSHPCSKGEKWKRRRERLQQPVGECHTWLHAELWGVTHLLLQLLRCNVGSFSPTHFLGMVLHGCVHNSLKNATEICRMGTTADYAKPLKDTHRSVCSIHKKILVQVSYNFLATNEKEPRHLIPPF